MKTYLEFDQELDQLLAEEKTDAAIKLMEKNRPLYPDHDHMTASNILFCHRELGNFDRCLEIIQQEHKKGYFFGLNWDAWDPIRVLPDYKKIISQNEKLKADYQIGLKPAWEVHLPAGYKADQEYPLLLLLHGDGNGCNIDFFSSQWKPEKALEKGWITAYIQSSQVSCYKGFGWTKNYKKSREDILTAFSVICNEYQIDRTRIILGGFSGGSMASLNLLGNNTLPLRGVIALCPDETEDTDEIRLGKAAGSGVRVVILEGELSEKVPYQEELMKRFRNTGIPAEHVINPATSHAIPRDMNEKMIEAMKFIMEN